MNLRRAQGLTHLYLDKRDTSFSDIAAGYLIRAAGHGLKIAYVDIQKKGGKIINFLENLSLSHKFVKSFERLHIETFTVESKDKISKGIIPLVEFQTISNDIFWQSLKNFDLIIFEGITFKSIDKFKILSFLRSKNPETEAVFICSRDDEFDELKVEVDSAQSIIEKKTNSLVKNKHIISYLGEGRGKSVLSFGYLIRKFIEKHEVKLVYFDKGDMFYGEMKFFTSLKTWKKTSSLYGSFDFVNTGIPRFDGPSARTSQTPLDKQEAKEALMLLKTALKKQTPVVADHLTSAIKDGLLDLKEVVSLLETVDNELIITGSEIPKEIKNLSTSILEVKAVKKLKMDLGRKKGIDF